MLSRLIYRREKVTKDIRAAWKKKNIFSIGFLCNEASGVLIFSLFKSGIVNHCVSVDESAGIIFCSADEYPLEFI